MIFSGGTGRRAARLTTAGSPWQLLAHSGTEAVQAAVAVRPWGVSGLDAHDLFASDEATGSWLCLGGQPLLEPATAGARDTALGSRAVRVLGLLQRQGLAGLASVRGSFSAAWWNGSQRRLYLLRDRFGIEPLFYSVRDGELLFGSRIRDFSSLHGMPFELSMQGLVEFLTYCFVPGNATLDHEVWRVPPAHALVFDPASGRAHTERWYRLSYARMDLVDEGAIAAEFRQQLEASVVRQLGDAPLGAFLSGGMDSSSVVTFVTRHLAGPVHTFGFRCAGASFDESHYARALSAQLGTSHHEVEYGEAQALTIADAVGEMEVPFCDIGIEIGTWLLAASAGGTVPYLLTGDGGDEFWASHPVYAAQRLVSPYDRAPLPASFRRAVHRVTSLAHDSDSKRGLAVVVKRLVPPPQLPASLGPFRWRVYYTPEERQRLLQPSRATAAQDVDAYGCVLSAYDGYDGPDDGISPHLYCDYTTASSFYFSRLLLLRRHGLEARLPFYDHPLVELGARIPARKKLEGVERTKRLFRVAMEGTLPDVINHRKDKLGHSVPLKNWLRTGGPLATLVRTELEAADSPLRDLVQHDELQRMFEEHRSRRHNHSHRLWAAYVLGTWLRKRAASVG